MATKLLLLDCDSTLSSIEGIDELGRLPGIGPKAAETERYSAEILRTPMLLYTKSAGVFAGATVKAGHLSRNDKGNFLLYNTKYTMPELLYSDWVQPPAEVQPLMALVQRLAP